MRSKIVATSRSTAGRLTLLLIGVLAVVTPAGATGTMGPVGADTTLVVRGTIASYDPPSRILALSTSNGTVQFAIPAAARVRQRGRHIDASALQKLKGFRAAVRYSESGATKIVESVSVLGKDDRAPSPLW